MIGAVDIGGTKIAVGMVDGAGAVVSRLELPTAAGRGPADGLERIAAALREAARLAGGELDGIGVSCTGQVDYRTGVIGQNAFLPGWQDLNLAAELQRIFGVTAALENDADAAALGEYAWGTGQGCCRFIYVTVSTGIGAGLVFDGRLYRGMDGSHPEIGHHVIDPTGPRCFCGARGCWESLAGGLALAQRGGQPTAREVCVAAVQGDARAVRAVEREAVYLGLGLANLVTLFVPDVIALGGGVMRSRELFWSTIEETIRQSCGLVPAEGVRLVPASTGPDVGLTGAAQAWRLLYGEK